MSRSEPRDNRWKYIKLIGKADGFTADRIAERFPPSRPGPAELSEDAREIIEEAVARFPPVAVPAGACGTKLRRDDLAVRLHLIAEATGLGRVRLARELGMAPGTVGELMARGRRLLEANRPDELS